MPKMRWRVWIGLRSSSNRIRNRAGSLWLPTLSVTAHLAGRFCGSPMVIEITWLSLRGVEAERISVAEGERKPETRFELWTLPRNELSTISEEAIAPEPSAPQLFDSLPTARKRNAWATSRWSCISWMTACEFCATSCSTIPAPKSGSWFIRERETRRQLRKG